MTHKIKSIAQCEAIKRLAARTAIFFALTVLAFMLMRPLTISTGHTDVLKCMNAAAVLAWAEISIMWIRIAMSPRLNEQAVAEDVQELAHPFAMALVYCAHVARWAVRLGIFIYLYSVAL
ncbi:MAG: hypothetical protein WA071_14775 [Undibacterium umbellatum]|uniref:hypothetical protein n=1 Tax=Undibacterium umbellatum TaxID=2762300 RepID=UPI003BB805A1